ncbi:MAG: OprO/OprP family phosphate-selective porin [Planctomycetaceae bacterium]|jgi:phosphate-selective porin OprO/OprP|nr:OprO/OprP family phosphate-selective porin [Planctomycetaceae bacterium]
MSKIVGIVVCSLIFLSDAFGVLAQSDDATAPVYSPVVDSDEQAIPVNVPNSAETTDLEARISALENSLAKQKEKQDSANKITIKSIGRVYMDGYLFADQKNVQEQENYFSFRNVWFGVRGEGYKIFDYSLELAFEPTTNGAELKNVFVGVKNVPFLDYVRAGYYKVETGMAYLQSPNHSTAMELAHPSSVFAFNRRLGVSSTHYLADDRLRWFAGVFGEEAGTIGTAKSYVNDSQGTILNTRLTMLPLTSADGKRFFHTGAHYTYVDRAASASAAAFRLKPGGIPNSANIVNSGFSGVTRFSEGGVEFAYQNHRWALQSELYGMNYSGTGGGNIYGGYVEARCFLADCYRSYEKKSGVIGNIKMEESQNLYFEENDGMYSPKSWGVAEAFVQWAFVNASDLVPETRVQDITAGITWYWNPNTRTIFEYIHSMPEDRGTKGSIDALGMTLRYFF